MSFSSLADICTALNSEPSFLNLIITHPCCILTTIGNSMGQDGAQAYAESVFTCLQTVPCR